MTFNLLSPTQYGVGSSNFYASSNYGLNSYNPYGGGLYGGGAYTGGIGGISPYGFGSAGLYGSSPFMNLAQDRSFMQAVQSLANGLATMIQVAMGDFPSGDEASAEAGMGADLNGSEWLGNGAQELT